MNLESNINLENKSEEVEVDTEKVDTEKVDTGPTAKIPSAEEFFEILEESGLPEYAEVYGAVVKVCEKIKEEGGRALLVGGNVRDMEMGKIPKDFDLEVYELEPLVVEEVVSKASDVGKAFGILKMSLGNGIDIDVSLPRTDSKIGEGRRGFEVKTNPHISITDAAKRRDFTMNSRAADPLSGEIFDPLSSPRCGNQVKLAQNREKYFFRLVL